jgi:hypothetical protein
MTAANEPWHCAEQNVHHLRADCPYAQTVGPAARRPGAGGHPLCEECEQLTKAAETTARVLGISV